MTGKPTVVSPDVTDHLIAVTRALSDSTRLRIFLSLRHAERCVRDLVDAEGISQPLVSHHLKVLAEAGLVQSRRTDGFHLYALSPEGMEEARTALVSLLDVDALAPEARPGGNSSCCQ